MRASFHPVSAPPFPAIVVYDPDEATATVADEFATVAQAIVASGFDPTKDELIAYAADKRWQKEVGGVTIGGVLYPTDRETQSLLACVR